MGIDYRKFYPLLARKDGETRPSQSPAVLVEYLVLCSAQNEGGQYPSRDSGDERPDCQQPTRMGIKCGLNKDARTLAYLFRGCPAVLVMRIAG